MKKFAQRSMALLLVLLLVVGLLPGITISADAATVNYLCANTDKYSNVIVNWGIRGELATFLSPNAVEFYEDTSYEELVVLDGGALYLALYNLMKNAHTTLTDYDDTKDAYRLTDCQNNGYQSATISGFYSGVALSPKWDGGQAWNREHTWPQSKSAKGDDIEDIMSIRPESTTVNSSRNNNAYGKSTGFYNPNIGEYDLRGDVARVVLYTYVRWGGESDTIKNNLWGTAGVFESEAVLLEWMEADPVDTWEMGRNDSVESITGTRNVFVDYPELAFALFDEEIPQMDTPSGSTNETGFTITAKTNNNAYGTVTVNGNHIAARPAVGYTVSGAQVISGSNVTLTQNGNVFTVNASGNCTIQVNFVALPQYTATVYSNGTKVQQSAVYSGSAVTLPSFTGTLPSGYSFYGWAATDVGNSGNVPVVYGAGQEVTITKNSDFYAVLAYFNANAVGSEKVWKLVTNASQLGEGKEVIIAASSENMAMGAQSSNNKNRTSVAVNKTEDTLLFDANAGVQVLTLKSGTTSGTYSLYTGSGYLYAPSSSENLLRTSGTLDANGSFEITINSDKTCGLKAKGSSTRNILLYNNSSKLFSCYGSSSSQVKPIALYVGQNSTGATYYTTSWSGGSVQPPACAHTNVSTTTVNATCTQNGSITKTCDDCGKIISTQTIPASHTMVNGVCTVCGEGKPVEGGYKLISLDNVSAGNYIIGAVRSGAYPTIYPATATIAKSSDNTDWVVSETSVTATSDTIREADLPADAQVFVFAGDNTQGFTIGYHNGTEMVYLGYTDIANSRRLAFDASYDDIRWIVQIDPDGGFALVTTNGNNKYAVSQNSTSTSAIRGYKNGTIYTGIYLFAKEETQQTQCRHLNEYPVETPPTCTEMGYTTLYCPDCDREPVVEDYVEALGHSYQAVVTKPTFTTAGYTTHTCSACDDSYVDSQTKMLAEVDRWGLILEDDLTVRFEIYVDPSIVATAQIVLTVGETSNSYPAEEYVTADNICKISIHLAAAQMTEKIGVKIVNGSDSSPIKEYSVLQYAKTILGDASKSKYHQIVKDMLAYGGAAQAYFGYNTGLMADADVEGAGNAEIPNTADAMSVVDQMDGLNFYGATLLFREKIAVRFYFAGSIQDVDFGQHQAGYKDGLYYIEVAEILPQDLNRSITCKVQDGNGNSLTVTYSPMNYLVRMNEKGSDSLKALLKALYNYHLSAQKLSQ